MLNFRVCTPRIDRFIAIAAISASLVATCAAPSFARHHNNNTTPATASEVTTSISPAGTVDTTVTTATMPIDYSILADPDFRYFDIKRAQAYGLTDYQIAQAAKLAHYAEVPMGVVLDRIEDGSTMNNIAWYYGVPINVLDNVSDWQDRVHEYMRAYHNTGMGALRNGPAQPSVASYSSNGMTTGPAMVAPSGAVEPNGATVAPNGTTVEPNGTTIAPNGTTVTPNGTTTAPNGTTVSPGGTTTSPDGTTVAPSGATSTTP